MLRSLCLLIQHLIPLKLSFYSLFFFPVYRSHFSVSLNVSTFCWVLDILDNILVYSVYVHRLSEGWVGALGSLPSLWHIHTFLGKFGICGRPYQGPSGCFASLLNLCLVPMSIICSKLIQNCRPGESLALLLCLSLRLLL